MSTSQVKQQQQAEMTLLYRQLLMVTLDTCCKQDAKLKPTGGQGLNGFNHTLSSTFKLYLIKQVQNTYKLPSLTMISGMQSYSIVILCTILLTNHKHKKVSFVSYK